MTITVQKTLVTPTLAQEWLKANVDNRPVCRPRVDLYVSLLKEGRFVLTHQGIAFYENGDLADGQHRLHAIAESQVSAHMMVTKGLPFDHVHAIDNGRPRSVQNVLHFVGINASHKHIAAGAFSGCSTTRRPRELRGTTIPLIPLGFQSLSKRRKSRLILPCLRLGQEALLTPPLQVL